ncbi:MAG: prolyl oligopeptidase family serine peptidase [Acidobacteria bacterium]|nr:prolyl oligopeptidase family serine peptidase [Acidobacteriota bacterium]
MPKNLPPLLLTLALTAGLTFTSGALALDYSNRQGNPATFETLEETRVSSPAAAASQDSGKGAFKSHPVLDGYPEGTTYVYRSANLWGGRALRSNTNILVFAEKSFPNKDAALTYLKNLGMTDIIDAAIGSVVLVTPSDPKAGFAAADQKHYYALQTAMLSLGGSERSGDIVTTWSDGAYFGGFGFLYAIGIDGGATFFNNYIASTFDYASRIAGALLINGRMEEVRKVAAVLPAYLVNPTEAVAAGYKAANETDAARGDGGTTTCFNQALPLQQVTVHREPKPDAAAIIKRVYDEMFSRTMRVPVVKQGLHSAGTPFQGYTFDQAPYSLAARNIVTNGVTRDGVSVFPHQEDRFSGIRTPAGEYLQTWYEYVPGEVLQNGVAAGTVPLVIALHGGGDDPQAFVEEVGWLEMVCQERFILVAPEHQGLSSDQPVLGESLAALAAYMMKTYPAIDASRVYASGYSMGGGATLAIATSHPRMLAAVVDMAGAMFTFTDAMEERFEETDLPFMYLTSAYDLSPNINPEDGSLSDNSQVLLNAFLLFNGMDRVRYDFEAHPKCGFQADAWSETVLNGEHRNFIWYLNDRQGVPMVALSYTADLVHALYPQYAGIAWDYLARFSRNRKTGAVQYHP